eukprot:TRINITY_DN27342_c1_g1_i5.p1 TRINITY_DN27342_c1_g1~~TRINITY_DN27342_c1_g1_i5.p1  ORF type:complete len:474 (+),score=65.24 TRINITY_DN27342_c1_g1_i5:192-1424(+)
MQDGAAAAAGQRPAPPGAAPPDNPSISAASRAERPAGSGRRRSRPLVAGAEAAPRGAELGCSPAADDSSGPVEEAEAAAPQAQEPGSAQLSGDVRADDEDGDYHGAPRSSPSLWEEADGSAAPPFLPSVEWAPDTAAGAGAMHDEYSSHRERRPEQQQQGPLECGLTGMPTAPPPPPPEDAMPTSPAAWPDGGSEGAARRWEIYDGEEQNLSPPPPPPPESGPSRRACSPLPPQHGRAALGPRRKARQTGPTPLPPERAPRPTQRAQRFGRQPPQQPRAQGSTAQPPGGARRSRSSPAPGGRSRRSDPCRVRAEQPGGGVSHGGRGRSAGAVRRGGTAAPAPAAVAARLPDPRPAAAADAKKPGQRPRRGSSRPRIPRPLAGRDAGQRPPTHRPGAVAQTRRQSAGAAGC